MVMDCPPHQERDAVFVWMYPDEKARAPLALDQVRLTLSLFEDEALLTKPSSRNPLES
jgi:hypothetical protein